MRQFIQNESIIPYTDRIQELKERGISTILVIGGSSEYLKYGDRILLLEDYRVFDRTWQAKEILSAKSEKTVPSKGNAESDTHQWMMEKMLPSELSCNEFFYSQCVQIDNARYIKIDDITVDVTSHTVISGSIMTMAFTILP